MVAHKRKKNVRLRGSKTHGYGSMKKHRGAGHRGGRGNAGSGSAGTSASGSKKPTFWRLRPGGIDPEKRGFKLHDGPEPVTINVGHVDSIAKTLLRTGKALEQSGAIVINLRELGYDKLLGAGKVTNKLKIGVASASPSAIEKVKAAGGSVDAQATDREAVLAERASHKGKGKKEKKVAEPEEADE